MVHGVDLKAFFRSKNITSFFSQLYDTLFNILLLILLKFLKQDFSFWQCCIVICDAPMIQFYVHVCKRFCTV